LRAYVEQIANGNCEHKPTYYTKKDRTMGEGLSLLITPQGRVELMLMIKKSGINIDARRKTKRKPRKASPDAGTPQHTGPEHLRSPPTH
jgi:hypothetical protein